MSFPFMYHFISIRYLISLGDNRDILKLPRTTVVNITCNVPLRQKLILELDVLKNGPLPDDICKAYIPLQHETTRVGASRWVRPPTQGIHVANTNFCSYKLGILTIFQVRNNINSMKKIRNLIPTCWYRKSLADPSRVPINPTRVLIDPT